jgi:hypothetical protein
VIEYSLTLPDDVFATFHRCSGIYSDIHRALFRKLGSLFGLLLQLVEPFQTAVSPESFPSKTLPPEVCPIDARFLHASISPITRNVEFRSESFDLRCHDEVVRWMPVDFAFPNFAIEHQKR